MPLLKRRAEIRRQLFKAFHCFKDKVAVPRSKFKSSLQTSLAPSFSTESCQPQCLQPGGNACSVEHCPDSASSMCTGHTATCPTTRHRGSTQLNFQIYFYCSSFPPPRPQDSLPMLPRLASDSCPACLSVPSLGITPCRHAPLFLTLVFQSLCGHHVLHETSGPRHGTHLFTFSTLLPLL